LRLRDANPPEMVPRMWYNSGMYVALKPELERFIDEQVKAGRFESPAEVLEAGLARLMLDPPDELDEEDLAAIDESEAQIARGEDLDWKEVSAQLRRKYLGE
jgi:putative addiction module CopG family antidote